jgi:hypothetical protein
LLHLQGINKITFAPKIGTIDLKSDLPVIQQSVIIDGAGANVVIDGQGQARPFFIDNPAYDNNAGTGNGSTIDVTIENVAIRDGSAKGGDGGGGGGLGAGGAIFVDAGTSVSLIGDSFAGNSAVGGNGGDGGGGGGLGGDGEEGGGGVGVGAFGGAGHQAGGAGELTGTSSGASGSGPGYYGGSYFKTSSPGGKNAGGGGGGLAGDYGSFRIFSYGGGGGAGASGKNGGFGGGGGGGFGYGLAGGNGGFGGGGGSASVESDSLGAPGGIGGFGGGGGGNSGGFGYPGYSVSYGLGGAYGGQGGIAANFTGAGGGGAGLGGSVFVRAGGKLAISGNTSFSGDTVAGGLAGFGPDGVGESSPATDGSGAGADIFLQAAALSIDVPAGQTETFTEADAGTGSLTKTGAGTLVLAVAETFSGAIAGGTLEVAADGSLAGNVAFAPGASATLRVDALASSGLTSISGFTRGDVVDVGNDGSVARLDIAGDFSERDLVVRADGSGGTEILLSAAPPTTESDTASIAASTLLLASPQFISAAGNASPEVVQAAAAWPGLAGEPVAANPFGFAGHRHRSHWRRSVRLLCPQSDRSHQPELRDRRRWRLRWHRDTSPGRHRARWSYPNIAIADIYAESEGAWIATVGRRGVGSNGNAGAATIDRLQPTTPVRASEFRSANVRTISSSIRD